MLFFLYANWTYFKIGQSYASLKDFFYEFPKRHSIGYVTEPFIPPSFVQCSFQNAFSAFLAVLIRSYQHIITLPTLRKET